VHADVPGTVEGNPVFAYHDLFNPNTSEVEDLKQRYREGRVGDGEVKDRLTEALNEYMRPIRERRAHYVEETGLVDEVLWDGTQRMREIAQLTMRDVRSAMGLDKALKRMRRAVEKRQKKQNRTDGAPS
jgi:tryptophanyl-tRNA synthetase